MAGDDNEAGHGASGKQDLPDASKKAESKPVETKSGVVTGGAVKPETIKLDPAKPEAAKPAASKPIAVDSEWTASDARGPLNAVGTVAASDATSAVRPASSPAATAPSGSDAKPVVPPRKASLWPVAAGIVVGAALGAGSAYYIYTTMPNPALDQKFAALSDRIDTLDKKPDAQKAVAPLTAALGDLTTKVAAVETVARTASATADAAKAEAAKKVAPPPAPAAPPPAPVAAAPSPDFAPLQAKVAALETALGALKQQSASTGDLKAAQSKITAVETSLSDVQKQIADGQKQASAAQGDLQTLRAGQKSLEGKITSAPALAVVADSLVSQISRGLPFPTQVNALDSLGVDPAKIAILRQFADQGVPSAKTLLEKFEPLTDALLTVERKPAAEASFWDRMKEGAGGLVAVHRVDDVSGDDVPSRVARIRADLANNDVIDAVATWAKLPADAKAKPEAAAWGALSKTHAEAIGAANAIEHDAIAALSTKKS